MPRPTSRPTIPLGRPNWRAKTDTRALLPPFGGDRDGVAVSCQVVGRPKEHGEGTRKTLLEAAEGLLTESGIAAVTVRSVADRAGTTTRAVYALFGSKEGLVQALAARGFDLVSERLDSLPLTGDPVEDFLTAAISGFRAFAIEHPDLFRLVFIGGIGVPYGAPTATTQSTSLGRRVERGERLPAAGLLGAPRGDDA